jgi:hypothetical protein
MQKSHIMAVAWPSFLAACGLEMLVFVLFDPQDAHWLGHSIELSRQSVYSLSFFVFWALVALACALSVWLSGDADTGVR